MIVKIMTARRFAAGFLRLDFVEAVIHAQGKTGALRQGVLPQWCGELPGCRQVAGSPKGRDLEQGSMHSTT